MGSARISFQSTRPLRGATGVTPDDAGDVALFQSTRPLRGATCGRPFFATKRKISIHAPLAGRDRRSGPGRARYDNFNPRAPCGARPAPGPVPDLHRGISIHAPLAGRDMGQAAREADAWDFNPRAPCGARRGDAGGGRGMTNISIHAPLAGRDHGPVPPHRRAQNFNPRAPCGARPRPWATRRRMRHFNPRAPCGARPASGGGGGGSVTFQSTRPLRGATANLTKNACQICAKGTKFTRQAHQRHGISERLCRSAAPERLNRRCEPPDTFLIA